jgi:tetratricopeptide (TPR) repeat protein
MRQVALLCMACLICLGCTSDEPGETKPPNYLIMAYSAGEATAGLPHTDLLEDPQNQSLLRACSQGASLRELTRLPVDSLEQRMDRMCRGSVLNCEDSVYRPTFPLFAGADRDRLDSIADWYANQLVSDVRLLLEEMGSCGDVKPDERFHVLWSMVMDDCWYSIWERLKPTEPGPPQVCWIVDPPHEYTVGTNFWQLPGGSMAAATWSPDCDEHLESLTRLRLGLLRAAWQMPVNDSVGEALLGKYGLLDADRTYPGMIWRDSTPFASQLEKWKDRYSEAVTRSLGLKSAATALGLPEGQTFVILLHEVAYALFRQLADNHDLEFPEVLKTGRPTDQTVDLISVQLVRRPLPEDVVEALWMANSYHGTDEIVNLIREILATDPDNLGKRLLLGMSLYDLERYDEAVVEFQELSARAAADMKTKQLFDWSRIWLGHVYDARGERVKALEWYQAVMDDGSPDSKMSFGQYRIGPIDAVTWARERIATPFRWR